MLPLKRVGDQNWLGPNTYFGALSWSLAALMRAFSGKTAFDISDADRRADGEITWVNLSITYSTTPLNRRSVGS